MNISINHILLFVENLNQNIETNTDLILDKILFNFVEGGPKVEIHGNEGKEYNIIFIHSIKNEIIKEEIIKSGEVSKVDPEYYVPWRIIVKCGETIVRDYTLDLTGKTVLITYESSALGDTIAWMPYVEEFRKKYNCNVITSSFQNEMFKDIYPNITFINRGVPVTGVHVVYRLGWFGSGHASNRNPNDCHVIPLQKVASDILGLDYVEIRPLIKKDSRPSLMKGKYVAITTCSTAQFKYWNHPTGWQDTVNYYNSRGYKVVVIGKQPNFLKNVIDFSGPRDMKDLINIIQYSEYFIGLPSGLTWLSWALGKKSIMITGISKDFCEFREDCYRVENLSVCHGCFNNPKFTFAKNDWLFCPEHKNTSKHFECTKTITPQMVQIESLKVETDIKNNKTHYSMSNNECDSYLNNINKK